METALTALGAQSGLTIIVETKVSRGIQAAALTGAYTKDEALKKLLEPAGLRAEYLDTKTVAIRSVAEQTVITATGLHQTSLRLAQNTGAPNTGDTEKVGNTGEARNTDSETAQSKNEDLSKAATEAKELRELEEVVVSGIRGSVQAAQEVKRRAPSVVEAITAEDLGKFTDSAISDALQRVPGLNIERNVRGYEGGDGVTIRGLGPSYLVSTINGRELAGIPAFWGSGGRDLDYGSIPPEILAGVMVYKSPTSEMVEAGLAGEVDLRTLRPLDYETRDGGKYFGSVSLTGEYQPESDKVGPRVGGVLGGKFLDETLGVYVSALRSTSHTEQDMTQMYIYSSSVNIADENGDITTYDNINSVYGYAQNNSVREYEKRSVAAGLQWKPNANLDVNGDFVYNEFVTDMLNFGNDYYSGFSYYTPTGAEAPYFQPGGAILRGNALVYADSNLVVGGGTPFQLAGLTHVINTNKFYNGGLNAAWTSDDERFKVTADASHGINNYLQDWRSPYADNAALGGTQSIIDLRGDKPIITFNGPAASDISQASSYGNYYYFFFQSLGRGERNAFKLDFAGKVNDHFTVKTGARYVQSVSSFVLMFGNQNDSFDSTGFFNGKSDYLPFYPLGVPQVSESGVCASNPNYCNASNVGRGSFTGTFPTTAAGNSGDNELMYFDWPHSYYVKEKNLALYGQLDMTSELFGMTALGNAGVRAVRMGESVAGFQGIAYRTSVTFSQDPDNEDVTVLAHDDYQYWEYLPSFNLTLQPRDNINLRLGIARTMSLPPTSVLAPVAGVTFYALENGVQNVPEFGGNTRLKPTKSWNYDVTGEYYTSYGGSYIGSVFYKDVSDLVAGYTINGTTVPGFGDTLFNVSTNINADKGYAYGFELGTNQPLTFLPAPWDGLGVQANYTYTDSSLDQINDPRPTEFPGSSKHNANASVYYEKYNWAARVAASYRSEYLSGIVANDSSRYADSEFTVDANLTRTLSKNIQISLSGSNLTNQEQRNSRGSGRLLQYIMERPRTYSLTVRADF